MSPSDRRALLRRADLTCKLVGDRVLDPVDALLLTAWPSPRAADLIAALPASPIRHGTLSGYKRGCDCVPCRQAKRAWDRAHPSRVAA